MEKSYEDRAQALLKKLKRPKKEKKVERPFFIELTGPPTSGKTTIISILDPFFRRQGFRVYTPQEGAEVIRHIPRTSHLYNVRTGLYALSTLIDASVNDNYDLVIFDRGLCDVHAWMDYWNEKNDLAFEDTYLIQSFFCFSTWMNMIDVVFYVVTTAEEAIKRDMSVSLTEKFGGTTNPENLRNLVNIFKNSYNNRSYPVETKNIFLIDTTDTKITEMTEMVLKKALDALELRFE